MISKNLNCIFLNGQTWYFILPCLIVGRILLGESGFKLNGHGGKFIFRTEYNSKKPDLSYFHHEQVDVTCERAKEIFKWDRM